MKLQTLSDLICPKIHNGKKCHKILDLHITKEKKDEILYGLLICTKCRTKYPIIQGIPILLSDIGKYLKDNFAIIKKSLNPKRKDNEDLFLYMSVVKRSAFQENQGTKIFDLPSTPKTTKFEGYKLLHYGDMLKTTHAPFMKDILKLHKKKNAYTIIKNWLEEKKLKDKKTIDVGCSFGRLTLLLAKKCSFSYGVDISFTDLLTASRIIKHVPNKLSRFKVKESGKSKTKTTNIIKSNNLDFILASADNLPFKDNLFEVSINSNIVDIASKNVNILKEAGRTLEKKGELFVSFVPFFRRLESEKKDKALTSSNIKKAIKSITFYKEFKHIPFIMRNSENFYNLYNNCCMLGRKKTNN
ncbi:MAG: methyltransferase domain-containing protein [Candidatus Omnitrophica bacterium]|nr:methyltransferase domain-containing protein [Candidatus Omnitrophota bacterium]